MKYSREAVLLGAAFFTSIAGAEPFTYQGVLQEAGMAADGVYDIRFELYDSSNKSTQLGSTLTFDDVAVSSGTFTVDLDFGSGLFDGSDRFLFIEVRDGASAGGYTGLLPAIEIMATPEAQHAMTADTVLNPQWMEAPGVLIFGEGEDHVMINRSTTISGNDYLTVHGDSEGFVGMYVSGPANSLPFYGYSVNNAFSAYTYYNPSTDEWILDNSGTALTSDSSHNLIAAGDMQGDSFRFNTPKTSYLSVPATAFHSTSNEDYTYNFEFGSVRMTTPSNGGALVAPVQLPHGASITGMRVFGFDNTAGADVIIQLSRFTNSKSRAVILSVSSTGTPTAFELSDSINPPLLVDNSDHSFSLAISSVNWPGNPLLDVQNIVIEYTTTEAD